MWPDLQSGGAVHAGAMMASPSEAAGARFGMSRLPVLLMVQLRCFAAYFRLTVTSSEALSPFPLFPFILNWMVMIHASCHVMAVLHGMVMAQIADNKAVEASAGVLVGCACASRRLPPPRCCISATCC